MTKAKRRDGRSNSPAEKGAASGDLREMPVAPPYRARRWLLLTSAVVLAAWITLLAYLALAG
jgi:hypothetical protein